MRPPRYVEVPLANGDTARVEAWPCSTPGLIITEAAHWYGYEITHEESLTRICGPFQQRAEAVSAARRLGETPIVWDLSREQFLMDEITQAIVKDAIKEVMQTPWKDTNSSTPTRRGPSTSGPYTPTPSSEEESTASTP